MVQSTSEVAPFMAPQLCPLCYQRLSATGRKRSPRKDTPEGTNCLNTGALDTNRTCDLPLRRGLLYPLSYEGDVAILTRSARRVSR
jgi:hypothetical protein